LAAQHNTKHDLLVGEGDKYGRPAPAKAGEHFDQGPQMQKNGGMEEKKYLPVLTEGRQNL